MAIYGEPKNKITLEVSSQSGEIDMAILDRLTEAIEPYGGTVIFKLTEKSNKLRYGIDDLQAKADEAFAKIMKTIKDYQDRLI